MLLMANGNGDWLEVHQGSCFYFLDTESDSFEELKKNEGIEDIGEWLAGDKLERDIWEYGKEYSLNIVDGKPNLL